MFCTLALTVGMSALGRAHFNVPVDNLILGDLRSWLLRPLGLLGMAVVLIPALYRRCWLSVGPLAYGISGVVGAAAICEQVVGGNVHSFAVFLASLLSVVMLLGFLFWQAAILSLVQAGGYLTLLTLNSASPEVIAFQACALSLFVLVSLIFVYNLERSLRTSFLQTRVLEIFGRIDGLTGLRNRRAFDESLSSLWKQAAREQKQLGMLILDVDFFKQYNDEYGHQAGDSCLKQIASVLYAAERRPLDISARIGGEEFALICFGSSEDHMQERSQLILSRIRELNIPHADSDAAPVVTASIGATIVSPSHHQDASELTRIADEALYAAKNAGRNQAKFYRGDAHVIPLESRLKAVEI